MIWDLQRLSIGWINIQRFLCSFILEATKFILENNTFQFNDKYYIQISGTAMGTKMAPTYATLTMGFLEEEILNLKLVETFGIDIARNIQDNWFGFVDGCIILCKPDFDNINSFIGILNILHPKIKFSQERQRKYTIPGYHNIQRSHKNQNRYISQANRYFSIFTVLLLPPEAHQK